MQLHFVTKHAIFVSPTHYFIVYTVILHKRYNIYAKTGHFLYKMGVHVIGHLASYGFIVN